MSRMIKLSFSVVLYLYCQVVFAASYGLPTDIGNGIFASCSGSGGVYNCSGDINIGKNDTVTISSNVILNISGKVTVGEDSTIANNGLQFMLNVTGQVDIKKNSNIQANINANGNINIDKEVTLVGNISSSANIVIDKEGNFNGNITAGGSIDIAKEGTFVGDIIAVGNIVIDKEGGFIGNVTAGGTLDIGKDTVVNGICTPSHSQCTGSGGGGGGGGGGQVCNVLQIAADNEEFRGVSGSSDSNVIAVGHNGGIYHYDGTDWTKNTFVAAEKLHDVEVVSSNLAYAVGHNGEVIMYNGVSWSVLPAPTGEDLNGVWAHSSTEVWVAGKNDTLYLWNGSSWADMSSGAQANVDNGKDLEDVWGGSNSFYAVEKDGDLYRYARSAGPWDKFIACNSAFDMEAKDIWGDSLGNIYIAGKDKGANPEEAAVFLYAEGTNSCSKLFSTTTENKLEGIYGNGNTVFGVGKKGLILDNSTGSWLESNQGSEDLKDVWVSGSGTAYYAGKNGFMTVCNPPATTADHLSISHDGFAINCQAEPITISAHTSTVSPAHVVDTTYSSTVNLTTSSNNGDWSYVSGGSAARLVNNGNGSASYQFDGTENGQVVLALFNPVDETISINASDGSITETSGAADASDDPSLNFDLAGFQFLGNGTVNNIGTQIAGKSSNTGYGAQTLQLQAWNTNQSTFACEAVFNSAPITVDFTLECVNPNSCQRPIYIGSSAPSVPVTSLTPVDLDFSGTAQSLADFVINYPDAGQVLLHARYTLANGQVLNGSSLPFVSRPFGFDVAVAGNPGGVDHNGAIFTSAGTPFQINVSAELWDGTDGGADGIPDNHDNDDPSDNDSLVNNTVTLGGINYTGVPSFGQEGEGATLSAILIDPFLSAYADSDFPVQTLAGFTAGSASTSAASFNDVGVIEIRAAITDSDYLGINAVETGKIISKSGYVGRFIPAAFDVTVSNNGIFDDMCTSSAPFTYIGQDFGYLIAPTIQVRALNALTPATVTENYRDNYVKLGVNAVTVGVLQDSTNIGTDSNPLLVDYSPAAMTLTVNNNGTVDYTFGADMYRYGDSVTTNNFIKLTNSEVGPFVADIDPEITLINDGEVSTVVSQTINLTGNNQRFGRMRMSNAHGSELLDLQLPVIVEYFNGSFYQINLDDACTVGASADINLIADNLSTPGSSTLSITNPMAVDGDIGITLSAPGAGITGQVDLSSLLSGGTNDNKWLRYDWDSGGLFDDDPFASATFGIFSGEDVNIYIQQIYQ